ncbi:Zinc finger protein ZFPM2 [Labeo rohita]|uniref:Zinc finger protein ZFPM2 n=1 Tax=Labeo rohita TaxID=84645 RepID=A0ABQ8MV51_LABRO|nr:Zinc finger protein ZFPM2 [Labeo rohita]
MYRCTELNITAAGKYKELLTNHSGQRNVSVFTTQCASAIQENPAIEDCIKALKASVFTRSTDITVIGYNDKGFTLLTERSHISTTGDF